MRSATLVHQQALGEEPDSIAWQEDYAKALEDARTANRLLWVQFTGPWCPTAPGWNETRSLIRRLSSTAQRSFVPLKLRSDVNDGLATAFNLTGLPATIIIAPNRDIIAVHQGYLGPEDFDTFLSDCLARHPVKPAAQARSLGRTARPSGPG